MLKIIKLIVALAILAGAIFVPDYRTYLNPIIGIIVGYYFADNRVVLLGRAKKVLGIKAK